MMPFAFEEPRSFAEAVAALDPEDSSVRALAGGTALMLMMKAGVFAPTRLVSLEKIEARYSAIEIDSHGSLRVGAMASLASLEYSAGVAAHFPIVKETLRTLSNIRVRNVARVGGALAHGDPHMDLPPLFAALGAKVIVRGKGGVREIPVDSLYLGYYETALAKDELIAEVLVPALGDAKCAYMKCTSRSADDWPALGIAVRFEIEGGIKNPRLVVSAATDKVTRLSAAESVLEGAEATDTLFAKAGQTAAEEATLLSDAHGSAAYKRELLRVYLVRALRHAMRGKHA
jgi:aerobic carbon-monoxide dehydrogenase medium subunit